MRIAWHMLRHLAVPLGITMMHVGAHRAQEARRYEAWGVARVIWIEANPRMAVIAEQALAAARAAPQPWLPRLLGRPRTEHILVQALVGDEDGREMPFHLYSNDGASNSIYRKTDGAREEFPQVAETGEVLTLKMRRLDSVLDDLGIAPEAVQFITLDVQGAELLCLRGAPRLLRHLRFLETEISKRAFYEGGVLFPELDAFLRDLGFRQRRWLRKWHMNAVYTR